nr:cyclin-dependent protein kinase inhibitor SMR1-like [Ipomoea batatas]
MSADLDLRRDLQQTQLPRLKISPPDVNGSDQTHEIQGSTSKVDQEGGGEECRTPRSPRSTIPAALECPPAPRKPRRRAAACKRKLSELKFLEMVAGEEIESFFGANAGRNIRRCLV